MAVPHNPDTAVAGRLACPSCKRSLIGTTDAVVCPQCAVVYPHTDGIWWLLTEPDRLRYASFQSSYRAVRRLDGWEQTDKAYYLQLPNVAPSDRHAAVWRIRQRSFQRLKKIAGSGTGQWALDLGAGNGWLARRLSEMGYATVALDPNVGGADSLEGAAIYMAEAEVRFARIQAAMEKLPFQDASFALCTVSGALHYAPLGATLAEIWRVLVPGGRLIITDSPVYTTAAPGQAMITQYRTQTLSRYGYEPQWPGGSGFLVWRDLLAELRRAPFRVQSFAIDRPLGRIWRRVRRTLTGKRETARFPVIVARKDAG